MRIIKLHGKITVQFMDAEFTSNGDFAETLKDIVSEGCLCGSVQALEVRE